MGKTKVKSKAVAQKTKMPTIRNDSGKVATQERLDGWSNILTGLGQINKDKNLSTLPEVSFLDQGLVEALYQVDDISAKIVDLPVNEMFREGFKINIPDDDGRISDWIFEELERLKAMNHLIHMFKEGRLYGSACLFFGTKGSKEAKVPASPNQTVDYLRVIDRYRLNPSTSNLDQDLSAEDFGYPLFYSLIGGMSDQSLTIHKSWIYRFDGVRLPYNLMQMNGYWGDSVLSRPFRIIQIFNSAYFALGGVVQDFNTPVFKLQNLVEMIAQNKEEKILQRMALAMLTSSVFKGIVLQTDESYERTSTTVTGVSDLVNSIKDRLATAAEIPHTILFSEAPGGSLGGTGTSEKMDWYDKIKALQSNIMTPALMEVIKRVCMAKGSITGGIMPENLTVEYFPLWQPTEKEQLETKKLQADIDSAYIASGVYSPEEVAVSRFGSGEYSYDTKLDFTARDKFEADDKALTEEDGNADDDTADEDQA